MAGDVGKELPRNRTPRILDREVGRRKILGGLAKLGAVAAVGQWAGRKAREDVQTAADTIDQTADSVGSLFKRETKRESVTVELHEKPDLVSVEFKTIFPNLTEEERALALEQVRKGKVVMLNNLTNEAIVRIADNEDLIRSSAKRLGASDEVANLLVGLDITASNGTADALG